MTRTHAGRSEEPSLGTKIMSYDRVHGTLHVPKTMHQSKQFFLKLPPHICCINFFDPPIKTLKKWRRTHSLIILIKPLFCQYMGPMGHDPLLFKSQLNRNSSDFSGIFLRSGWLGFRPTWSLYFTLTLSWLPGPGGILSISQKWQGTISFKKKRDLSTLTKKKNNPPKASIGNKPNI